MFLCLSYYVIVNKFNFILGLLFKIAIKIYLQILNNRILEY
jgi:hypothetical protein